MAPRDPDPTHCTDFNFFLLLYEINENIFPALVSMVQQVSSVPEIREKLEEVLEPLGFETSPFLVGWYNSQARMEIRLAVTLHL